ncbi:ComF family protein [Tenacibaculum sp. M341]|uniref:ComF family protein n=1 Tax=Tenacibaculum sp. M341 TaxID=2530339 RepID=UPI0010486E27|nr:phosphoribosyltransferase family protein [Tenacibaculum sp. M341]TCI93111.1 ComF family protein [Tenacibaculum sp. M341]
MRFFKDFINIFYPNLCVNCQKHLYQSEKVLCSNCVNEVPITDLKDIENNFITNIFYGKSTIEKGFCFLFYQKNNITQKLIHNLKYKNREDIGVFLANWMWFYLKKHQNFSGFDLVIPVPLHKSKFKLRGYNQLTSFGETLSKKLNVAFLKNSLVRVSKSETQTFKSRFDRFHNSDTKFKVKDVSALEGKHVLLIDDVVTTGATLQVCCNELQKVKNIKISILTMAYTKKT